MPRWEESFLLIFFFFARQILEMKPLRKHFCRVFLKMIPQARHTYMGSFVHYSFEHHLSSIRLDGSVWAHLFSDLFRDVLPDSSLGSGWATHEHPQSCPEATPLISWPCPSGPGPTERWSAAPSLRSRTPRSRLSLGLSLYIVAYYSRLPLAVNPVRHCKDGIGEVISSASCFPPNGMFNIHAKGFSVCLIIPENFVPFKCLWANSRRAAIIAFSKKWAFVWSVN